MADRGLTIEESLALHQAKLAIPVFNKGKSQLDPISVEKSGESTMCVFKTKTNKIYVYLIGNAHILLLIFKSQFVLSFKLSCKGVHYVWSEYCIIYHTVTRMLFRNVLLCSF